eukprot:215261-Pelagomonas_calceolata.AAC.3
MVAPIAVQEADRLGSLLVDRAEALEVESGANFTMLKDGKTVLVSVRSLMANFLVQGVRCAQMPRSRHSCAPALQSPFACFVCFAATSLLQVCRQAGVGGISELQ